MVVGRWQKISLCHGYTHRHIFVCVCVQFQYCCHFGTNNTAGSKWENIRFIVSILWNSFRIRPQRIRIQSIIGSPSHHKPRSKYWCCKHLTIFRIQKILINPYHIFIIWSLSNVNVAFNSSTFSWRKKR